MAFVTITGKLSNAGDALLAASREPRLWARPAKPYARGHALFTDHEVRLDLNLSTGEFSGQVDNSPGVRYVIGLDVLVPGQEQEAPGNRARSWVEWTTPFHPGDGGDVGDLVPIDVVSLVWVGESPPPIYRIGTRWLDMNENSPNYGWLMIWEA